MASASSSSSATAAMSAPALGSRSSRLGTVISRLAAGDLGTWGLGDLAPSSAKSARESGVGMVATGLNVATSGSAAGSSKEKAGPDEAAVATAPARAPVVDAAADELPAARAAPAASGPATFRLIP